MGSKSTKSSRSTNTTTTPQIYRILLFGSIRQGRSLFFTEFSNLLENIKSTPKLDSIPLQHGCFLMLHSIISQMDDVLHRELSQICGGELEDITSFCDQDNFQDQVDHKTLLLKLWSCEPFRRFHDENWKSMG